MVRRPTRSDNLSDFLLHVNNVKADKIKFCACSRAIRRSLKNRIWFERASQKQSSDTHKTPYDRVKRCRERKIIIKASERVNPAHRKYSRTGSTKVERVVEPSCHAIDRSPAPATIWVTWFDPGSEHFHRVTRGTLPPPSSRRRDERYLASGGTTTQCAEPSSPTLDVMPFRPANYDSRLLERRVHHFIPVIKRTMLLGVQERFDQRQLETLRTYSRSLAGHETNLLAPVLVSHNFRYLELLANRVQSLTGSLRIFASGNRAGRCRWSAGFLRDLPCPPPLYSGAAPSSPHFALIGSQDVVAEMNPALDHRVGNPGLPRGRSQLLVKHHGGYRRKCPHACRYFGKILKPRSPVIDQLTSTPTSTCRQATLSRGVSAAPRFACLRQEDPGIVLPQHRCSTLEVRFLFVTADGKLSTEFSRGTRAGSPVEFTSRQAGAPCLLRASLACRRQRYSRTLC
ncbi:hypothetical protein PR048_019240 [Dryococelus australis]|uniref:Uncharacterized protein n=1 Tax=Dryococelus australis TaxID=614101 RepID=A0ABQ9H2Z1_9NEOP|nr:hypothetical protein PR048_019240 [Dryococelus australis]